MGTYGPQATSAPAGAIILNPGDNVSAIVNATPAGATFYFEPGVYRGLSLAPKNGQTFIGAEGAVLNGAATLTNWTQSGNLWVIGGQTQQGPVNTSAEFLPTTERPGHPDSVFLDNVPLTPVDALSKVVPGTFYLNYTTDQIYIADNPAGHTVEAGKLTDAFHGNATNVTIENLVIEKYDPEIGSGAINAGQNWTIQNNEVRLNYAVGITVQSGGQILNNYVHDNGEVGVGGYGNNILVQDNELASNGFWSGIDPTWEAGGLKFAQTDNLVVQDNYSHDNNGSGMWSDIDSINTLYEDNLVVHNTINGISYEISYNAIIRDNTLIGNGYGDTRGWGWGSDINIQNSSNVQVYDNRVDMTGGGNGIVLIQQNRGSGAYGFYTTTNNQIHDNIIVDRDANGAIGGFADYNLSGMLNGGNTWTNNQYFMADRSGKFEWGGDKTFAQFKTAAHETGTISQNYPDESSWLTLPADDTAGSIVSAGQLLVVSTGQTSSGITVLASGTVVVSGGVLSGTTVSSGGLEVVALNLAIGDTLSSGGHEVVSSGGVASATTVMGGGQQIVGASGLASGAIVSSGGVESVNPGGLATGAILSSGGWQRVASGGLASGAIVSNGGQEIVFGGGAASGANVLNGGQEWIWSGGLASGTIVSSGGQDVVLSGGRTSGTVVRDGGVESVNPGGVATGAILSSGGWQTVASGGLASGTTVSNGGQEIVFGGGAASGANVLSGGQEWIWSGGLASGTIVSSGGQDVVLSGGRTSGTVVRNGGVESVNPGGLATGAILSGGWQTVASGGLASGAIVSDGGQEIVFGGGAASGANVLSGGQEWIWSGGLASRTIVSSGGQDVVLTGGRTSGTVVRNGGVESVNPGGLATGAILSGGSQSVASGGLASGTTVSSGGVEVILSGGTLTGATISGGSVEIKSGGMAGSSTVRISSGTLVLDNSQNFSGTVAGLATSGVQNVDLKDITFGSSTHVVSYTSNGSNGGTVAITDGHHTTLLNLIGAYTATSFKLSNDGTGGTLVTDPPISNGAGIASPH